VRKRVPKTLGLGQCHVEFVGLASRPVGFGGLRGSLLGLVLSGVCAMQRKLAAFNAYANYLDRTKSSWEREKFAGPVEKCPSC